MHYFDNCHRLLGAWPRTSTEAPSVDLTGGPGPLICLPLEKILRAPMVSICVARQGDGGSGAPAELEHQSNLLSLWA